MPTFDENAIANQDSTFAKPGQKTEPNKTSRRHESA